MGGSGLDSLVRHIHENIIRKVPEDYLEKILARVLDAASKLEIPKKNRDMLYETADELEKAKGGKDSSKKRDREAASDGEERTETRLGKRKRSKKVKGVEKNAHLAPLIAAMPAKPSASRRRRRKAAAAAKGGKKRTSGAAAATHVAK